jgi:hypothetical protein
MKIVTSEKNVEYWDGFFSRKSSPIILEVRNLAHEENAWQENKRFRRGHSIKICKLEKD